MFVPLFLTGWQFANHNPGDFVQSFCSYVNRGRHIVLATGDFGQRVMSPYEMQTNPNRAYRDKYD